MSIPARGPEAAKPDTATRAEEHSCTDVALPETYGRNRLVLLVVDPRQVHAYWEVTPDKLADARTAVGSPGPPPALLRFYGVDGSLTPDSFDVPVNLQSRNWYVHLRSPDKSYYAELGLKGDAGQFVPLMQSNVVRTPRAWPVMGVEEHFMQVDPVQQRPEPVSPPAFVRPQRDQPVLSATRPLISSHRPRVLSTDVPPPPSEVAATGCALDAAPGSTSVCPTAQIDAEEILKEKLAGLYDIPKMPRERSQNREVFAPDASVQEVLPLPEPELNLTTLAETRFVMGIFSHAPAKAAE